MKNYIISIVLLVFAAFVMAVNYAKAQTLTETPTVTPTSTRSLMSPTPSPAVPSGAPKTGFGGM